MDQTDLSRRIEVVLNRITRAQEILAANVHELQALVPATIALEGRLGNLLGSPSNLQRVTARSPIVDMSAMTITWGGYTCRLSNNTILLRFFDRLSRRPDNYVSFDRLIRDVWDGQIRSDETIRSTVRHLKQRLLAADMEELARSIQGAGRRYGLMLNHIT